MNFLVFPLLVFLALGSLYFTSIDFATKVKQNKIISSLEKKRDLSFGKNRFKLAEGELIKDNDWTDCEDADQECDKGEIFPIYLTELNSVMKDTKEESKVNTIWFKPLNEKEGILVSETISPREKVIFGALIQKGNAKIRNFIPSLIWKTKGDLEEKINLCSYEYDSTTETPNTTQFIKPTCSLYFDFNMNFDITPGDNALSFESSVETFQNRHRFEFHGEHHIEKIVNTGDIEVEASLFMAYANGEVEVDSSAEVEEEIENGKFYYPDFISIETINHEELDTDEYMQCRGYMTVSEEIEVNELVLKSGCNLTITGNGKIKANKITTKRINSNKIVINNESSYGKIEAKDFTVAENTELEIKNKYEMNGFKFELSTENLTMEEDSSFEMNKLLSTYIKSNNVKIDRDTKLIANGIFQNMEISHDSSNDTFNWWAWFSGVTISHQQTLIGNFYVDTFKNSAENSYFCNVVDNSDSEPRQITSFSWEDIAWNGKELLSSIEEKKLIFCQDKESCFEQLEEYYDKEEE